MASRKITAAVFVLSLLLSSTLLSSACGSCKRAPPPSPVASCPKDTLKLGACAALLGVNVAVGSPPYTRCCSILYGLGELEAALCLCIAIKANVLGVVQLNWPTAIELLLSQCNRPIPAGFKCQ